MTPCAFSPTSALHSLRPLPRFVTIAARWVTLSRQGILQVVFGPAFRQGGFHDERAIPACHAAPTGEPAAATQFPRGRQRRLEKLPDQSIRLDALAPLSRSRHASTIAIFRLRFQRCATYTRGTGGHHEPRAADPLASLALLASRLSLDAAGACRTHGGVHCCRHRHSAGAYHCEGSPRQRPGRFAPHV